jgi:hypothetical protein
LGQENSQSATGQGRRKSVKGRNDRNGNSSFKVVDGLRCSYTNADQLKNKMKELEVRMRDYKPHILGITEVKPKNSLYKVNPAEYSLSEVGEYNMFCKILTIQLGEVLCCM